MDKTYKRHSFTKLWIATAMFIFCCFATSAFAQEAVDADTFMTTTETITEVKTTPEIAETATASAETTPDTIGELALGLNTVWMLLAAMLVFFMQPGFALVEAGFTRVKNTANILMKNFVDFMFGSLLYWFIGFGLMFGAGGFIGMPHFFDLSFLDSDLPKEGFLVFQTVFCATAATIVSGAMAERTKFSMYLVYTIFISVLIYPISGHWTWGGGWLMNGEEGSFMMNLFGTTFHDFALRLFHRPVRRKIICHHLLLPYSALHRDLTAGASAVLRGQWGMAGYSCGRVCDTAAVHLDAQKVLVSLYLGIRYFTSSAKYSAPVSRMSSHSCHLTYNIQEDICSCYAVRIRCVLSGIVADALDARHKNHRGRTDARHHLGILASAGSHAAGVQSSG